MKIYLASDLHVEFFKNFDFPNVDVDVVVLAGDIHPGDHALHIAAEFQRHCQSPVIFVPGNHEYYGHIYLKQRSWFRRIAQNLRDVHFLDGNSVVIDDVRFLGATLWSNFELFGADRVDTSKSVARRCIADFNVIRFWDERFTPDDCVGEFECAVEWLETELSKPFLGKTIVITHFLPHRAGIHPMHASAGGDELTPYFTSDCSELMRRHSIDVWMYGHTHNSADVVVENDTRLVSNQRGYPNEPHTYTCFDPNKIIQI